MSNRTNPGKSHFTPKHSLKDIESPNSIHCLSYPNPRLKVQDKPKDPQILLKYPLVKRVN